VYGLCSFIFNLVGIVLFDCDFCYCLALFLTSELMCRMRRSSTTHTVHRRKTRHALCSKASNRYAPSLCATAWDVSSCIWLQSELQLRIRLQAFKRPSFQPPPAIAKNVRSRSLSCCLSSRDSDMAVSGVAGSVGETSAGRTAVFSLSGTGAGQA
jgi:hypothetical protein